MSERRTTEIKLRVTPGEKTAWQIAAEQRGVGLSKLIRDCVQEALWAEQNQKLDGTALLDTAIAHLRECGAGNSSATAHFESLKAGVAKPWMFEGRGKPCSDCGVDLPPHVSHCGTCRA